MVWMKTDKSDSKARYIEDLGGGHYRLTREKRGKLVDEIPDGWEVYEKDGRVRLKRRGQR